MITDSIDILLKNKEDYSTNNKSNYMPIVFIFIALTKLKESGYTPNSLMTLRTHLFELIQKFPENIISHSYSESQMVQKEAKYPRYFHHYMPIWIVMTNSLSDKFNINNFNSALEEVLNNIDDEFKGASYEKDNKRYTWSTALTLMGLSLLCDDFRFFSAKKHENNSIMNENNNKVSTIDAIVDPKKVFVVHGRDIERLNAINNLLKKIDLSSVSWEEAIKYTGKTAPFISEIIAAAFNNVQAVIVLFTGDEMVHLHEKFCSADDIKKRENELQRQSRPNVIFEAGYSFGLYPNRTIFVKTEEHKDFSDLSGIYLMPFDNSDASEKALINRLYEYRMYNP
jgi:predicted nucleotide-binding protein